MRARKPAKTGRRPGGREKEDGGRKHLTRLEVEKLLDAAKGGRNGEAGPLPAAADVPASAAWVTAEGGKRGTSQTRIEDRIAASPGVTFGNACSVQSPLSFPFLNATD